MENELTIGLVQPDIYWEDTERNLLNLSVELDRITEPADVVLLPEMFNTGFSINPAKCAEPVNGPSMQFMREKAREKNIVITGSILTAENGNNYNRLIAMFPDGSYLWYDKRHLFRMSEEYKVLKSGNKKIFFTVKGWKILPLVCYDLRFPVWSKNRIIRGEYEYDLLLYVASWPKSRHHVWKSLLIARAIENQAFVAGVNRIGKDGDGTDYGGESLIIDPEGVIRFAAEQDKPFTGTFTVSRDELDSFRRSFPIGYDWDHFTIKP
jgi:predicted amidohydrolase